MSKIFFNIRNQLLIAFSCFTLSGIIVTLASIIYFSKLHEIYKVNSALHVLSDRHHKTVEAEHHFFQIETSSNDFFKTGSSVFLDHQKTYYAEVRSQLMTLKENSIFKEFGIYTETHNLYHELGKYEMAFELIVEKIRAKGFKTFGKEGRLRINATALEKDADEIGLVNILSLRKHEMEYFLNHNEDAVSTMSSRVDSIKNKLWQSPHLNFEQRDSINQLLHQYYYSFLEVVRMNKEIGYIDGMGMTLRLTESKEKINTLLESIIKRTEVREAMMVRNLKDAFLMIIINMILTSMFLVYLFTRRIELQHGPPKNTIIEKAAPGLVNSL